MTVKTDDVTSGRRDVDPYGRLWAVQGQNGLRYENNLIFNVPSTA